MSGFDDITWEHNHERITLSPRAGGRIVSWVRDHRELVLQPTLLEGGLLRVLFAEEQYPGSSFNVPHRVLACTSGPQGLRVHLQHYWNTANWFMRAAGWPEKANELHIDQLLLDKIITYDPAASVLACELTITNLAQQPRYVTPWLHLSFAPWPGQQWVAIDGQQQPYRDTDIYWGSHVADRPKPMRLVHGTSAGNFFTVFGAATDQLKGMCGYLPVQGEFHQATSELRYLTIDLQPGQRWRANAFLALTPDWRRWITASPVELVSCVEPAAASAPASDSLHPMLESWMLPSERERGLMVLSFLDKPPFAASNRYSASHTFAHFVADQNSATARTRVMLYASRSMSVHITASHPSARWQLQSPGVPLTDSLELQLPVHSYVPLELVGPRDLAGHESVRVHIQQQGGASPITLTIASHPRVEPAYPYQVRQAPIYMEQRYREKLGPVPGATPAQLTDWQKRMRSRLHQWLEFNAAGRCDPEPRLVEQQTGPTCIREKWLVQTEPDIWVPGFLIRPRHAPEGPMPLIFHLHGSGPGKDAFAADEVLNPVRMQLGHELEYMPYEMAAQLNCLVYVPDGRGQGEMGETNPGIYSARMRALGVNNMALRLRDQIRTLDWLITLPEVDGSRIGSAGCSGGGQMTWWFAAADERIAASIVSSTTAPRPTTPVQQGYFHRMFADAAIALDPPGDQPVGGPAVGMLIAPRPLWILDGFRDRCVDDAQRNQWRHQMQQGRESIRHAYQLLDADDQFEDLWLEGPHCAGMTVANVVRWFDRWFSCAPVHSD